MMKNLKLFTGTAYATTSRCDDKILLKKVFECVSVLKLMRFTKHAYKLISKKKRKRDLKLLN